MQLYRYLEDSEMYVEAVKLDQDGLIPPAVVAWLALAGYPRLSAPTTSVQGVKGQKGWYLNPERGTFELHTGQSHIRADHKDWLVKTAHPEYNEVFIMKDPVFQNTFEPVAPD